MEITWYGGSCARLRGREGVVAADPFRSIVGPTGRGLTADIVSYGHPDESVASGPAIAARIAVVDDRQLQCVVGHDHPDVHDLGVPGVTDRVRDRLLSDPERRGIDDRVERGRVAVDVDVVHAGHLADLPHDRRLWRRIIRV